MSAPPLPSRPPWQLWQLAVYRLSPPFNAAWSSCACRSLAPVRASVFWPQATASNIAAQHPVTAIRGRCSIPYPVTEAL
jgi:hypothetical protein